MRLTLRTMLAYMDGILEPEDAEDIGKKIEESEYATNLLHRMRDVMRRLRLAAPSPTDRGPGLDANTVAEYLDNTLHDSRVTDFEKVCLDSDIHLAEVASCHQVLTLVLGEAAEIDPASRQRMYQLPDLQAGQAETPSSPTATETSSGDGESEGKPATTEPRRKPTVPDYLREPPKKRRLLPAAVALVATTCLVAMGLIAWVEFEPGTPLGNLQARLGFGPEKVAEAPGSASPAHVPEQLPEAEPKPEAEPEPEAQPEPEPEPTPEPEPARKPQPEPESESEPEPEPEVSRLPAPPEQMGGLMSDEEVLLRLDSESAGWQRVPTQAVVTSRQKLLALPTYRPLIALMSAGVTIQLIGGTQVELLPTDAGGIPGIRTDYGRLVMRTVGKAEARIRLQVGNRTGVITFADAESAVAVEVTSVHIPGADPETDPGSIVTDMYAETGQILWDEGDDQETVRLAARHWLMLMSQQPPQTPAAVEEFPKWITSDPDDMVGLLNSRASAQLEKEWLQVGRPADLGLREAAEHRTKEVRWLAERCLGYIGQFERIVEALNDPEYKLLWPDYIEELREAVVRSPEMAKGVRQAIEKQHPEQDAADLYRMLWGYTENGLKNRDAWKLVDHLNHETLALRVLSSWNLKKIFGLGLNYKPEDSEAKRKQPIQEWRKRLDSKEIWKRLSGQKRAPPGKKAPPPAGAEPQL